MSRLQKTIWKKILRLTLLVASLAYIVYFFASQRESLQIAFSVSFPTLLLIAILQLLYFAIQSWRFQIVMEKCSGTKLPYLPWLKIFILGRFLNLLFSQLGNVYRSVQLKKNYRISYTRYISGFASMAWIDICLNLTIAFIVILLFNPSFKIGEFLAWKILTGLLFVVIFTPILIQAILQKINTTQTRFEWIHQKLSEVLHVTVSNLRDFPYLCKIFGLGLFLFIRTIIIFDLYFRIFETPVPLPALAIFYAFFKLSFFFMLTPGNLGIQEVAWGVLSEQMGIGMGQGILMSGFIRVVSSSILIVVGILLGGIDLLRHRKEYLSLKAKDSHQENM